jgi:hypothetical protein
MGFQLMEESVLGAGVEENLLSQAELHCWMQLQLALHQMVMDQEGGVMYGTFEDLVTLGLEFSSVRVTWLSAVQNLVVGRWEILLD